MRTLYWRDQSQLLRESLLVRLALHRHSDLVPKPLHQGQIDCGSISVAEPGRGNRTFILASYLINSLIARSSPSSVNGNIRPPNKSRIILIDGVQPQCSSGTGLSQTQCS